VGEGSSQVVNMFSNRFYNMLGFILAVLILSLTLNTCSSASKTPRLRIINSGSYAVENLVVWFPEEQIELGDVPVGATTEYIDVPKGVYRYAAYRFEIDGEIITQSVIDFMGEEPLDGTLFTYIIDFDPTRVAMIDSIRLVNVNLDK
jgi:hypothetical protein